MADILTQANVGALGDLLNLSAAATAVAAGSGDATTTTGTTVDRLSFGNGGIPSTALVGVMWAATLASGKTLSIAVTVQDSADNSTFADFSTVGSTVVATGPSGGGAKSGQFNLAVDLRNARRYVRCNFNPDLSATGTDTATATAAGFFAGWDRLAAPTN
jgi:hypothetical protein